MSFRAIWSVVVASSWLEDTVGELNARLLQAPVKGVASGVAASLLGRTLARSIHRAGHGVVGSLLPVRHAAGRS